MNQQYKSLIINSPYKRPEQHWQEQHDGTLNLVSGRRPAGYEIFDARNNTKRVQSLDLVNTIRNRVDEWRAAGYPGVTSVTRRLLEHWHDPEVQRLHPFYFCQLEAIETLIWKVEATAEYRQGIAIPGDGGDWERLCNKMATGTGKTLVMAMIITWQVLNAVTYPKRNKDFSQAIFIVTPGLTVKDRLQVLKPGHENSYYDAFSLCPSESLREKLNQAAILIENWHTLMPKQEAKRSVVKKGPESDEAYTRRVLDHLANFKDIAIINDEAHHAYRPDKRTNKKAAAEAGVDLEQATRWIEGLDRLHKTRRIQRAFDLSATPFAPTGRNTMEYALFGWIVSDFGLNDAIEAGLVKTPRVVVRDDAIPDSETLKSRLFHIYRDPSVKNDLNQKAPPQTTLPKLVRDAITLLGADWRKARKDWFDQGHQSPPVMLTVCNRTETAARIEHYFTQGDAHWEELHEPTRTLRVDSKVLEKAEQGEGSNADKDYANHLRAIVDAARIPETRKNDLKSLKDGDLLRKVVDTVGKTGQAGQDLQNVISVNMLSEGWDAKNVTHILGLRAFTSQLLCEQVIGRGLRRVSYDRDEDNPELFRPEYVNVFGVPLSIFERAGEGGEAPPPPKPSTQIEVIPDRAEYELKWPNILRVEQVVTPTLEVDWERVSPLELDPAKTRISADLAPALGGAADLSKATEIDLEQMPEDFRLQRIIFRAARKAFEQLRNSFRASEGTLIIQLVRLTEAFVNSDKLVIPSLFHNDPLRRRILIALNIDDVVRYLLQYIREQNTESLRPIYDEDRPIGETGQMRTWYTTRQVMQTTRSHISHVVIDSGWEAQAANVCENLKGIVSTYAKNDHLGFEIPYLWNGSRRNYRPDFLIRLNNGKILILEIKGQETEQDKAKHDALREWIQAVNEEGGFGEWCCGVAYELHQIESIIRKHADAPQHYAETT
jgi:type III restriction enzyme